MNAKPDSLPHSPPRPRPAALQLGPRDAGQHDPWQHDPWRMALNRGQLDGRWLYESPSQAARWQEYARHWAPLATQKAVTERYQNAARAAYEILKQPQTTPPTTKPRSALEPAAEPAVEPAADPAPTAESLHLVGLGCGDGEKDLLIAKTLILAAQTPLRYHYSALDVSLPLAQAAQTRLAHTLTAAFPQLDLQTHLLHGDLQRITAAELLTTLAALDGQKARRLITCFGMFPHLDGEKLSVFLGHLLRPTDLLLCAFNLSGAARGFFADERAAIVAQYDNPLAWRWYQGITETLGCSPKSFDWRLESIPRSQDGTHWQIEVLATPRHTLNIPLDTPPPVQLAAGKPLRVFRSQRYTHHAAKTLLHRAGLLPIRSWTEANGQEGLFLAQRQHEPPSTTPAHPPQAR